ncbi:MAG: helix-turn-helix domain-containing protein [Burkholderiaceae bacterium]|nr:helix-turn-helix domain-containing protein [Burkholderiaceae bacterium]
MPTAPPLLPENAAAQLQALGGQIRAQRKALRISATAAAEAAGLSRVTLHRIEKGEPAVTIGAWVHAMAALGLHLGVQRPAEAPPAAAGADHKGWIPARIALADYPQLRALAWQVHGTDTLTPAEALGIYERNARHLDAQALEPAERDLIDALHLALASAKPAPESSGV